MDDFVDSVPVPRGHSNKMSRVATHSSSGCTPYFALFVALPVLLFLLIIGAITDWMERGMAAGFWKAVQPWLVGSCVVVLLICSSIIGWHLYLAWVGYRLKQGQAQLLQEDLSARRQANRLLDEARANGDNIKLSMKEGRIEGIEIVRATTLLEQSRIQQAGRVRQITENEPRRIAAPALPRVTEVPPKAEVKKVSGPALLRESNIKIPTMYDLASVMRRFSESRLFLGVDHHGRWIDCDPADQLCHGALNAVTGRGKTILVRGLETQLLKMGCEVVHADIKFTLSDEYGNDYKPIAQALMQQGDLDGVGLPHLLLRDDHICNMIQWLSGPELRRRLSMYAQGDHSYGVFYLFLEELAYLLGEYKWLGPLIAKLLVVGRSLGIKVVAVAQNFQVQNLKINSGMRENFESAWYLGGDWNSGAAILDMTESELKEVVAMHNIKLGKGVSFFRNNAVAYEPVLLRSGFASNDFVYHYLGRASGFLLPARLLPTADSVASDKQPLRSDGKLSHGGSGGRIMGSETRQDDLEMPVGTVVDTDGYAQEISVNQPVEQAQAAQGGAMKYRLDEEQEKLFCFIYPDIEPNKDDALRKVGANTAYRAHANELILKHNLMAKKQKLS